MMVIRNWDDWGMVRWYWLKDTKFQVDRRNEFKNSIAQYDDYS